MVNMDLPNWSKRGRPQRRFIDLVKEDAQRVGVTEVIVRDKVRWRHMIPCGDC